MIEIGRERHAILVHLSAQLPELVREVVETQMARYDAVIAFANPKPRRLLERLAAEQHWPKLVVRSISEPAP